MEEYLDRAVKVQQEFCRLYNTGPLIGIADDRIHMDHVGFEAFFPVYDVRLSEDHPDTEWLEAEYKGVKVIALRDRAND